MRTKRLAVLAAAALMSLAASTQAAPMLPRPFTFYQKGHQKVALTHFPTFHMYFMAWREVNAKWQPGNINLVKQYLDRNRSGKPLPPPPWYKVLKGGGKSSSGGGGGGTGGGGTKPPIPEPTSLALLGGGALFLIRRKREA